MSVTTAGDDASYRQSLRTVERVQVGTASIACGDALKFYAEWERPTCIVSDGPYGLGKYPGEAPTTERLVEWYAPHAAAWALHASADTTLWFWNSELGWATVHPVLDGHGWQYEECCIWDKGIAHVAGNCNSKTIRGVPVVTEVAVRYTRKVMVRGADSTQLPIKDWVRAEWLRSGLPMYLANEACGVLNAATRKYLTQCWRWYFPPADALVRMAAYCQKYGRKTNQPYFSLDGVNPPIAAQWERMRAKWSHSHGLTNVWQEPPVHNGERVRALNGSGYLHANQKPLALMERQIFSCTDIQDVVWEPFGGLCSASVAAIQLGRVSYAAELNREFFNAAVRRLRENDHSILPQSEFLPSGRYVRDLPLGTRRRGVR